MADLFTVNEYKDAEGLRGEKDDDRLAVIVPQVSKLVKTYCGTSFIDYYSSAKTETITIYDNFTSTIILSETPVIAVSSVRERTAYSESYQTLTTGNYEYFVDTDSDSVMRTTKNGELAYWAKGVGAVQVTYTAGYASTPDDLLLACYDLVNYYMKDEHKENRTLGGAQIRQDGTSSLRLSTDFPDHIKRVLDLYRVII
jgi:hypothetical protein